MQISTGLTCLFFCNHDSCVPFILKLHLQIRTLARNKLFLRRMLHHLPRKFTIYYFLNNPGFWRKDRPKSQVLNACSIRPNLTQKNVFFRNFHLRLMALRKLMQHPKTDVHSFRQLRPKVFISRFIFNQIGLFPFSKKEILNFDEGKFVLKIKIIPFLDNPLSFIAKLKCYASQKFTQTLQTVLVAFSLNISKIWLDMKFSFAEYSFVIYLFT